MRNVWAVTLEDDLWTVTGCWNHLLLLPTLHCIFPLKPFVGIWWWNLGFEVYLPALLSPQLPHPDPPPPPSTHPSHFEQSHESTNKPSSSHTACNPQTLNSDRFRAGLNVELVDLLWSLLRDTSVGHGWHLCFTLGFGEKQRLEMSYKWSTRTQEVSLSSLLLSSSCFHPLFSSHLLFPCSFLFPLTHSAVSS